jgi:hypothetical protein
MILAFKDSCLPSRTKYSTLTEEGHRLKSLVDLRAAKLQYVDEWIIVPFGHQDHAEPNVTCPVPAIPIWTNAPLKLINAGDDVSLAALTSVGLASIRH